VKVPEHVSFQAKYIVTIFSKTVKLRQNLLRVCRPSGRTA